MKTINNRRTEYEIDDIFLKRSSPRAMSGEPLSKTDLMTLLEAARFAPSANNNQPWRFIYTIQGTPDFDLFLSYLKEMNQTWVKNAGAIVILLSKNLLPDGKQYVTHSFDAGSAWENLALQGAHMNLVVHAMAGFEMEKVRTDLDIPNDYTVEVMIALGYPGKKEDLPEKLQEREAPSGRNNLVDMVFEGKDGIKKL